MYSCVNSCVVFHSNFLFFLLQQKINHNFIFKLFFLKHVNWYQLFLLFTATATTITIYEKKVYKLNIVHMWCVFIVIIKLPNATLIVNVIEIANMLIKIVTHSFFLSRI